MAPVKVNKNNEKYIKENVYGVKPLILSFCSKKLPQLRISA